MKTLIETAIANIGIKEDHNNPIVLRFFAEAGHPEIHSTSVAWCAAFVGAMLHESGYKTSGSLAARSYINYGTKLKEPVADCIVVFPRADSPTLGHVGIVEKVIGDTIQIISGNDNDMVKRSIRHTSSAIAFRMPVKVTDAVAATPVPSIVKSKIAKTGAAIGAAEVVDVATQAIDVVNKVGDAKDAVAHAGITDHLQNLALNPRIIFGLVVIVAIVAIIYWRWKDHQ